MKCLAYCPRCNKIVEVHEMVIERENIYLALECSHKTFRPLKVD